MYVNRGSRALVRTKAEMKAGTAAALIGAARRRFGTEGYAATRMEEICADVGLTRGALYNTFGGKDGLLAAVATEIDAEIEAHMMAAWDDDADPLDALVDCFEVYLREISRPENGRIMLLDVPAVLDPERRRETGDRAVASIRAALDKAIAAGVMKEVNTTILAPALNGAVDALARPIDHGRGAAMDLRMMRPVLDGLLDGFRLYR